MKLVVLVTVFFMLCGVSFLASDTIYLAFSGRMALAITLVFSGVLHLLYNEGVYLSYPDFLPQRLKIRLVYAVSDLQFAFASSLIFADIAKIFTLFILIYLFLSLFTKIKAARENISIKRGNYTGRGLWYLGFKIPEQLFLIAWTYYFGLVV